MRYIGIAPMPVRCPPMPHSLPPPRILRHQRHPIAASHRKHRPEPMSETSSVQRHRHPARHVMISTVMRLFATLLASALFLGAQPDFNSLKELKYRNIGPFRGGRVDAVS